MNLFFQILANLAKEIYGLVDAQVFIKLINLRHLMQVFLATIYFILLALNSTALDFIMGQFL